MWKYSFIVQNCPLRALRQTIYKPEPKSRITIAITDFSPKGGTARKLVFRFSVKLWSLPQSLSFGQGVDFPFHTWAFSNLCNESLIASFHLLYGKKFEASARNSLFHNIKVAETSSRQSNPNQEKCLLPLAMASNSMRRSSFLIGSRPFENILVFDGLCLLSRDNLSMKNSRLV